MPVVDASLVTSVSVDSDANYGPALRWWESAHRGRLGILAPSILLAELASAVARATGDASRAHRAVSRVLADPLFEVLDTTQLAAQLAAQVAADRSIKGCDAIYVALAQQLAEPLVTFDREQAERAGAVVQVIVPA